MILSKDTINIFKELGLFDKVNNETLSRLNDICYIRELKKNEHLFRDKEIINSIYIVKSGKVALYKQSESAQKKVIFILGKESIINEIIIDDLPSSINCEAFENAEIICFDRIKFIDIMKDDFELSKIIINSLAIKVRRLYRQSKNSIPIKVEKRVAAKLWKLSRDYGREVEEGTLIDLSITITYLADMFGAPRETISRALKILDNKGLIINKNKKIIIPDREKLIRFFKDI
ncbi:Crp/Fnr family transcriptional regulator [Clostridium celatum]|uniref:Crp/Fnr family transcriptional regulator n=1 Tax=Clostridium celatum TaxID=36834 RepID=UPI002903B8A2|nr:Crp/Fnr family transcriptional regulator [Clostridium celatum]MDU2265884.1 Crp/Fnr family transcriptional regulator [Clostridium celatum]MDU3724367.1 Crp/Fnr family transcriptional regulator [Clostridium celatum]MDU6294258.1 Crp/Fnr family transcriptional regulator [Clostridium celatum]